MRGKDKGKDRIRRRRRARITKTYIAARLHESPAVSLWRFRKDCTLSTKVTGMARADCELQGGDEKEKSEMRSEIKSDEIK
jgi:hypothetical protein